MKQKLALCLVFFHFFKFAVADWGVEYGLGFFGTQHRPGDWENQWKNFSLDSYLTGIWYPGNTVLYAELGVGIPIMAFTPDGNGAIDTNTTFGSGGLFFAMAGVGSNIEFFDAPGIMVFGFSSDFFSLSSTSDAGWATLMGSFAGAGTLISLRNALFNSLFSEFSISFRANYDFLPLLKPDSSTGMMGCFYFSLSMGLAYE